MNKKTYFILLLILGIFFIGCSNKNIKTNYSIREDATLDNFNLVLENAKILENDSLELIFKITNNSNNTITITPDDYFKLYDINHVQIPNLYKNNTNIIKSKNTITYTLQYNISSKEIYEVYFYSGIVENNIKFTITSLDLKNN